MLGEAHQAQSFMRSCRKFVRIPRTNVAASTFIRRREDSQVWLGGEFGGKWCGKGSHLAAVAVAVAVV